MSRKRAYGSWVRLWKKDRTLDLGDAVVADSWNVPVLQLLAVVSIVLYLCYDRGDLYKEERHAEWQPALSACQSLSCC
jgi:hypothetical protein